MKRYNGKATLYPFTALDIIEFEPEKPINTYANAPFPLLKWEESKQKNLAMDKLRLA